MKVKQANQSSSSFIKLKDENWLVKQRYAGSVVAKALNFLEKLVIEKSDLSLIDMSYVADEMIKKNGCTSTFLGYKGFPAAVCISVNRQLVHGIPTKYKLQDGDVVSFDLGATFDGVIADAARTFIFGKAKLNEHIDLINFTRKAIDDAVGSISIGKHLGCIGNTISKLAKSNGYSIVESYGGHGIELNVPHSQPFVSNKSSADIGIRFQKGMTLAIEPLFVIGNSNKTSLSSDGWTVICDNVSAHWEETIFIHDDKVEILTR